MLKRITKAMSCTNSGHVVSQVEDLGNLGFVTRAYIGRS